MNLWRIGAETRRYAAHDLSGEGARLRPGRWNDYGQPALYAACSISLAVLETAAHIDEEGLPLNRFLVRLEVPEAVWAARETLDPAALPSAWLSIPAGRASVKPGASWLASERSLLLVVPSAIVPEEPVVIVNPLHSRAREIGATVVRPFSYDRIFRAR